MTGKDGEKEHEGTEKPEPEGASNQGRYLYAPGGDRKPGAGAPSQPPELLRGQGPAPCVGAKGPPYPSPGRTPLHLRPDVAEGKSQAARPEAPASDVLR